MGRRACRVGIVALNGRPVSSMTSRARTIRRVLFEHEVEDTEEVVDRFKKLGSDKVGGTPEAFDALITSELKTWGDIIRQSGAKPE